MIESSKAINPFVFIAVLFSSMLGAQFFGVSLNKLALTPLVIYLFIQYTKRPSKSSFSKSRMTLLCWYFVIAFSSAMNLCRDGLPGYDSILLFNIIQTIVFYVPIILLLDNLSNPIDQLKRSIVIVAKINCVWGLVQFVSWYLLSFDFNAFVFTTLLHGVLGNSWTKWIYDTGTLGIRVTGLNTDPAFFAILLVLGFALTRSLFWKILFFFTTICAMSRVGLVTIAILTAYLVSRNISLTKFKASKKILLSLCCSSILFALFFIILYNKVDYIQFQVDYMVSRFSFISNVEETKDGGTTRHLMYIPVAIRTFFDSSLISELIGVGPRTGGFALITNEYAQATLIFNKTMLSNVWVIECDVAEILLDIGLLGFIIYYLLLFQVHSAYKKTDQNICAVIVAITIFGFMYSICYGTLWNLFLIALTTSNQKHDYPKEALR